MQDMLKRGESKPGKRKATTKKKERKNVEMGGDDRRRGEDTSVQDRDKREGENLRRKEWKREEQKSRDGMIGVGNKLNKGRDERRKVKKECHLAET